MSDKLTVAQLIDMLTSMPQDAVVTCQEGDYMNVYDVTPNISIEVSEDYADGRAEVHIELVTWERPADNDYIDEE